MLGMGETRDRLEAEVRAQAPDLNLTADGCGPWLDVVARELDALAALVAGRPVFVVEEHGWEHGEVVAIYALERDAKRHAALGDANWSVSEYELRPRFDADRAIEERRRRGGPFT